MTEDRVPTPPRTMRDALDELAEAFPVDDISDAPWVVERGSIAWMIREGENGPQVGNFILEADARWVAAARNAIEAEAAQGAPPLDVEPPIRGAWVVQSDHDLTPENVQHVMEALKAATDAGEQVVVADGIEFRWRPTAIESLVIDSQTRDLIEACAEQNIYSRFDMQYAFQPWALDVPTLREAMERATDADGIAAEYAHLRSGSAPSRSDPEPQT